MFLELACLYSSTSTTPPTYAQNWVDSDKEPSEQDRKVNDDLEQQYSDDTPYETEMDVYAEVLSEIKERGAKASDVQQALELLCDIVHHMDHASYRTLYIDNLSIGRNYVEYLVGHECRLEFLELLGYDHDGSVVNKMTCDKVPPLSLRTEVWTLIEATKKELAKSIAPAPATRKRARAFATNGV